MVNTMLRPLYLREEERVPVQQEAGWAPRGGKISFLTGFDTRSVQSVVSGYTGYAIAAHRTNEFES